MFQSDMVLLRRRQYKIIGLSYLIAQILSLGEFVIIFFGEKPGLHGCSIPCMIPLDNTAAGLRTMFTFTGLAPTQLFLISFWWLPRRYYHNSEIKDFALSSTPSNQLKTPLLFSEEQKETDNSEERKESGVSYLKDNRFD